MKRKTDLPELLAPAGDFECLVAAVKAGADAVYIGLKTHSARAYAENFDLEGLGRAVSYCHLHGVKLYVAVNTLEEPDRDFLKTYSMLHYLHTFSVDAIIVADQGILYNARATGGSFDCHASTQMSVHNTAGADEAYKLGCSRVVLARELSYENIKEVTEKSLAETEVFLHGALCVCHSGQCLFSSMVGGRSGNQGSCAQPCRLPYNDGKYILSLKDLSLANHIRELVDAGVASLKIEGRMKSPDYVYKVTSIYRRLLDECRNAGRAEAAELERTFSRSGFTDGYFVGRKQSNMTGIRTDEDKSRTRETEKGSYDVDRIPVRATARIKLGERSWMRLSYKDESIKDSRSGYDLTAYGDAPDTAQNSPLRPDDVKARLCKTGGTFVSLLPEDIELELDDNVNLSPAKINELRRNAVACFEYFPDGERVYGKFPDVSVGEKGRAIGRQYTAGKRTSLFLDPAPLCEINDGHLLAALGTVFVPLEHYKSCKDKARGIYIPPVIMDDEMKEVELLLNNAAACGAEYALVGNLSHIALAKKYSLIPVGDFRLNVTNRWSYGVYESEGISDIILSPELTVGQAASVGGRLITYGRIPLMLTERCFIKDNFGCEKCGKCSLTDRRGVKFPIMREYGHRNLILNSAVTYMGDKRGEISAFEHQHFIFSTETSAEIASVIRAFDKGEKFPLSVPFRRIGKRKVEN